MVIQWNHFLGGKVIQFRGGCAPRGPPPVICLLAVSLLIREGEQRQETRQPL